ncbi:MAG: plasmid pRiA4b ORF-3 family protein [Ardenticatenaceae bacterium]|nr:plasmid pRiA4b ORF-3 family protein [Ardenticatenaceae bacterium]
MAQTIFQFKVTLKGIRPPIWRRIQVANDITFYHFHHILQEVMGWENAHLHLFDIGGWQITDAETLAQGWGDGSDDQKTRLSELLGREGQKMLYEYDFGDSWEHELLLEKILPAEPGVHYPRCLKGKRACPPEDCGGPWGYEALLEALADADHEEHESYLEWVGDDFDPEEFDLEEINDALSGL